MGLKREAHVNGIRLAYCEWPGAKGPLICLPSLAGHKGAFAAFAERLAPAYRVLALDLRGRGDSDKPRDGCGFAYHARDVLAWVDSLGLDSFVLVGHSFGATAAVYLASIRPKRVRALAILDGGCDPGDEVLDAMRSMALRLEWVYPSMQAYLNAMRALPYYRPWSAALERYCCEDAVLLPDGSVRSKASAEAVQRDLDQHLMYSMCLHFPALKCPVLFLRPMEGLLGNRAHLFGEREAAAFAASIPNCRRVDLPDVNHYTMLLHDDPPAAAPVKEFLDEMLP